MSLKAEEFVKLVYQRFSDKANELQDNFYENRFHIEIIDALLNENNHAFHEYAYDFSLGRGDVCDIVITKKDNYEEVTHWIEFKPFYDYDECDYWKPSTFFGENVFRKDIEKLSKKLPEKTKQDALCLFLTILYADDKQIEIFKDGLHNVSLKDLLKGHKLVGTKGKHGGLTPVQILASISAWADTKPIISKPIPSSDRCWYFVLWDVKNFEKYGIKDIDENNEYYINI